MINTLILLYAVITVFVQIITIIEESDHYKHKYLSYSAIEKENRRKRCFGLSQSLSYSIIIKWIILVINFLITSLYGGLKADGRITADNGIRYGHRTLLNSSSLPYLYIVMVMWFGINLIYNIYRLYKLQIEHNNQINANSIKEGLDNLPSGICFYDKYGKLILCNRKMHELGHKFLAGNAKNMQDLENTYIFPGGEVWTFSKEELSITDTEKYIQILATNVTEIYKSMIQLDADNKRLKADAKELNILLDNIEEAAREKELLRLKILIHNEMGACLTATKRILEGEIPQNNIEAIFNKWKETISISNNEAGSKSKLMMLREEALSYGIEIIFRGKYSEIIEDEIICSCIRVCMNNAVKYAKADRLIIDVSKNVMSEDKDIADAAKYVIQDKAADMIKCVMQNKAADATKDTTYYNVRIRNNGKQPDKEITEGGGLSNIRQKIEEAGGYMKIQSTPEFELYIRMRTSN